LLDKEVHNFWVYNMIVMVKSRNVIIMSHANNRSCDMVLDLKKYNSTSKIHDQNIILVVLK